MSLGDNCSSGCRTRDHENWGQCQRAKNLAVVDPEGRVIRSKWDKDLDAYAAARRQGVQPENTSRRAVDDAMILSDVSGSAYQA